MAHFAKLNELGIVQEVIVVSNTDAPDPAPINSEPLGQAFIAALGLDGEWKQTSFNNSFRKQYAGIGFSYDADADVFIAPRPFNSWTLDENYDWQPPVPKPTADGLWQWDEVSLSWVER